MTDHERLIGLGSIENLNYPTLKKLVSQFGNLEKVCSASEEELTGTGLVTAAMAGHIIYRSRPDAAGKLMDLMDKTDMQCVTLGGSGYPRRLTELYDPPLALYYKGVLPPDDTFSMAVIGARKCTAHGFQTAKVLSRGIASAGFVIVSGMARGIDCAAHMGALELEKPTVAVLGSGADVCYPRENMEIYYAIQSCGCVISELPPGTPPVGRNFPKRNRIIAALSNGIVMVEAKKSSGSQITVDQGLSLGKDIYAVPGRVDDPLSEGCNALIRDGARLVTCADDILEEYNMQAQLIKKTGMTLDNSEKLVYASICLVPRSADELSERTGLSVSRISQILISLQMKGAVKQIGKNQFILNL